MELSEEDKKVIAEDLADMKRLNKKYEKEEKIRKDKDGLAEMRREIDEIEHEISITRKAANNFFYRVRIMRYIRKCLEQEGEEYESD